MQTAWQSMRLGIAAYIVPFVFAYSPALLLIGSPADVIRATISALLGIAVIAMGLEAYCLNRLRWFERLWAGATGVCLIAPTGLTKGLGAVMLAILVLQQWIIYRRDRSQLPI